MKRLSVIIPIYNIEPFVERCIRSLEDQDIPRDEYEIICINDGSRDNSREVVLRMQKEFNNIILVEQENKGVSCARNSGMNKACGRYLLFIDGDDYVETNTFKRILNNTESHKAQVSFLGITILNEFGTISSTIYDESYASEVYTGLEAYSKPRIGVRQDPDRIYAVLFESEFININKLRFLPDVPYLEDGEFITRILCIADRCIFDGHSFYQRTTRLGSATNSELFSSDKATKGFLLAVCNLKRFQEDRSLNEERKKFLNQPIVKYVKLSVDSSTGWMLLRKLMSTVKTLRAIGFRKIKPDGCYGIYQVFVKAYNLSPYFGVVASVLYPRLTKVKKLLFPNNNL